MFKMCEKCGFMYEDNGKGCPHCNSENEFKAVEKEITETKDKKSNYDTKRKNPVPIIIAVIVFVLVAVIIGVVFLGGSNAPIQNDDGEAIVDTSVTDIETDVYESNVFEDNQDSTEINYERNVYVESVLASSVLVEAQVTHFAENVFDNDISTAWVEGSNGNGIGDSLTIQFDKEYLIEEIAINAGYQKSDALYMKNSRPHKIELSFSDGTSEVHYLDDINDVQYIKLDNSVVTDVVVLTIDTVYSGTAYEDTCISEIKFNVH